MSGYSRLFELTRRRGEGRKGAGSLKWQWTLARDGTKYGTHYGSDRVEDQDTNKHINPPKTDTSAIAISPHVLSLLSLPLLNHFATLIFTSLALLLLPFAPLNHLFFGFRLHFLGWTGFHSSQSVLFSSPRPPRESICPVYPSLWSGLSSSVRFRESAVWVLVSRAELWVLESGDPRKNQKSVLLGKGWKRKRRRERWKGGNLRVQNAKCWCVCFPSPPFRAMTWRKTNGNTDILHMRSQLYSQSNTFTAKGLWFLRIKSLLISVFLIFLSVASRNP